MNTLTRRAPGGAAVGFGCSFAPNAQASEVSVLMPDRDNLQYLAYWVALGAGHFEDEGIAPRVVAPEHPRLAIERFTNDAAPLAVLPAPLCFALISDGIPLSIVANLLSNDAINLVLSSETSPRLPASDAPLGERLAALRDLRIGIAPNPDKRLDVLLGLADLSREQVKIVTVPGPRQNEALEHGDFDALYCHTPYLERALTQQGARLYVNQSAGEIPALTQLQVHTLVAAPSAIAEMPELVQSMVNGLVAAVRAAKAHPEVAARAIASVFPDRSVPERDTIAGLYAPALPVSLRPTLEAALRTRPLFPSLGRGPIAEEKIAAAIDDRFAVTAEARASSAPQWILPGALVAAGAAAGWLLRRKR